ncbi:hypothetical protein AMECASPLE_017913 [Ameca splendens]|uniref:Uncharacterized protein n=1 Tax=Ameca splendens TaxID=208324 RepID=A0ABV0YDX2_9TELE
MYIAPFATVTASGPLQGKIFLGVMFQTYQTRLHKTIFKPLVLSYLRICSHRLSERVDPPPRCPSVDSAVTNTEFTVQDFRSPDVLKAAQTETPHAPQGPGWQISCVPARRTKKC